MRASSVGVLGSSQRGQFATSGCAPWCGVTPFRHVLLADGRGVAWAQTATNTATVRPPAGVTDPTCNVALPECNSATDSDTVLRTVTITKTLTGAPPAGVDGAYAFNVACANPVATYSGTVTLAGGASTGSTTVNIPVGSTGCTVTETSRPPAPTNYTWGVATYVQPASPIPATGAVSGTITNPLLRPVLTVAKSNGATTVGNTTSYTVTITNRGGAVATGVSYSDAPGAGLTVTGIALGTATGAGTVLGTCTTTGCTGITIAAGGSVTYTVTANVTAANGATVTNTANVGGGGCTAGTPSTPADCTSTDTDTVAKPVLAMAKAASAANFTVGVAASYTLQVTNTGSAATTDVATITDTIPAGLTIGTLPAGCAASAQTVTCTIAAGLAAGANTSFTIPVTPTLAAGTSVTNSATVRGGGDTTCPTTGAVDPRCTSQVITPVNAPQLTLTKTASASPWTVGVAASYTLSVQNTGTAATTAMSTITDTIPTGLTIGTLPAGCSASGQTVTCTIAAGLAVDASTSFEIPVTPTSAAAASVTNAATAAGGGDATCSAATPPARCSSAVTTPVNRPQLTLTKAASTSPWTVGVPASYTLNVSNGGTAATTAVATITDTIPTGLTIGTLPAGCSASGQTVTCTIAVGLAIDASTSFVIPVTPTLAAAPSVTNTASVTGGGDPTCPAAARCTDTEGPTTVNAPQLTLTKTASASPWTVGVAASYTLQVTNTGTTATTAVATITDAIPAGLTIGTLPAGCSASGQTVTCTIAAGLAVDASTSFVIPVTPTLAAAPSVTNTASVTGGGDPTCPAAARCTDTEGPTTVNAPQLTLAKTASSASFTVGVAASYTLQVTNTGSAATTDVATITDAIPAGLTIGTLPAGCSASGQTVTCTIAVGLAIDASTSFVIPVTPTAAAGTSVTNTASVSGGGDPSCPAAARCGSSVTTAVGTLADVSIVKSLATPNPAVPG
nr:DUF11 domain-containing protein [Pseudoxanthomonas sp.]